MGEVHGEHPFHPERPPPFAVGLDEFDMVFDMAGGAVRFDETEQKVKRGEHPLRSDREGSSLIERASFPGLRGQRVMHLPHGAVGVFERQGPGTGVR